ncbi:MAG: GlmU family protein [Cytophagales bacterium]|nr:GlmU family protein [Cytophagales bacterium]
MNTILFDDPSTKKNLLPFTFTRPVSEIRVGALTIKEKWEKWLPASYSYLTEACLSKKFPTEKTADNLFLNGSVLPGEDLILALKSMKRSQMIVKGEMLIAFYGNIESVEELNSPAFYNKYEKSELKSEVASIQNVYDIFLKNEQANRDDFELLTKGKTSYDIEDPHTRIYNRQNIFVEENVSIKSAILNAEKGPIYIGKNAVISEGSIIRGATSIGENSIISINARIVGDSTIGPHCKVGGEISNSVIFGYSSKGHDGFIGNSVVGEWCNIGADTNTSNLKNNYKNVRIWNYLHEQYKDTGRQFCGLMMADHSKCGINTMFNTGTVVGVCSNIFGSGFPPAFIPSFSWGGAQGFDTYQFEKAMETVPKVLERRGKRLNEEDMELLNYIFKVSKKYRKDLEL